MKHAVITACACILLGSGAAQAQDRGVRPQPVPPPSADIVGVAHELPEKFEAVTEAGHTHPGDRVCPSRFADPRTGGAADAPAFRLVRSTTSSITAVEGNVRITRETAYGDYWVDVPNRYGVELGQALRIDCVTGQPIGLVARFPEER